MWMVIGTAFAALGTAFWIIAATADRVFNGADAAGVALLAIGVGLIVKPEKDGEE